MAMTSPVPKKGSRRQIEQALRKSEERNRLVVEAAPNAMVMVDAEGRIEMPNTQAERVFGYSRTEMLGQPVEMFVRNGTALIIREPADASGGDRARPLRS
jgi:two-component system, sensor histidine kinase PdtaS